jgi:hypothetical protein
MSEQVSQSMIICDAGNDYIISRCHQSILMHELSLFCRKGSGEVRVEGIVSVVA